MPNEMQVTATIKGLDELKAAFRKISDAAAAKMLENAAMAGALPIQNAAKDKAPKKTRTLARSIHSEIIESSRDKVSVAIGTDVDYAAIQEFGGSIHQTNAWGKGIVQTITIPAHPYLRPALAENSEKAAETAGRVLKSEIEGASQ